MCSHQAITQAAGYYEGYITASLIEQLAFNIDLFAFVPPDNLAEYLLANQEFTAQNIQQAQSLPPGDPMRAYWYHVSLTLVQLSGINRGYQAYRHGWFELLLFVPTLILRRQRQRD